MTERLSVLITRMEHDLRSRTLVRAALVHARAAANTASGRAWDVESVARELYKDDKAVAQVVRAAVSPARLAGGSVFAQHASSAL